MQLGFFDRENREKRLTELGDNLEKLNNAVDWEMFRPILKKLYTRHPREQAKDLRLIL